MPKKPSTDDGQPILTRYTEWRNSVKFREYNRFQNWIRNGHNGQGPLGPTPGDGHRDQQNGTVDEKWGVGLDNFGYTVGPEIETIVEDKIIEKDGADDVNDQVKKIDAESWTELEELCKVTCGPDRIIPSDAIHTCQADGSVRLAEVGVAAGQKRPISVPSLLTKAAARAPNRVALAVKRDGVWQKWSYSEYLQEVRTVAKAFIALGLERFHSVCILGFNTPEWFFSDLGAIFAGGFAAGIYTTNTPSACAFCAIDSKANIFVVEDEAQLAKVLEIRDQLPHLKAIVQFSGEPKEKGVLSWQNLLTLGDSKSDKLLNERLSKIAINQCCTLIYTSGTTGNPKGVMLSHDNVTWTAQINCLWCNFRDCQEEYISFLPLSHVAAQLADIYCPLTCCASVYFGDKNALKGSLIETMKEVRPTKFFAVPRVWEKMYERMQEIGRETKGVKKIIATWAKEKGLNYNLRRMEGVRNPGSFGFWLANKLILSKVRAALGFARCDLHLSGAAPISKEILKYFFSLNIVVTEVYGMSECSGPHCMAIDSFFRLGSCGKTLPGCLTKIGNPDADGNGEILMGGRHVSMGYLHQPEKTIATIDPEGWLHSEDVGHVDKDGYIFITGRLKEILITAGGENVAPVPIEDRVKQELPFVSQAVVLGDRLKYLSVLVTVKSEVDKDTQEPLEFLTPLAKQWLEENGDCHLSTVDDTLDELYVHNNTKLRKAIQAGMDRVNSKSVSSAQKLQKWHLLPVDFSIPGGELGPTLKLKRQVVYAKYKDLIDDLYS